MRVLVYPHPRPRRCIPIHHPPCLSEQGVHPRRCIPSHNPNPKTPRLHPCLWWRAQLSRIGTRTYDKAIKIHHSHGLSIEELHQGSLAAVCPSACTLAAGKVLCKGKCKGTVSTTKHKGKDQHDDDDNGATEVVEEPPALFKDIFEMEEIGGASSSTAPPPGGTSKDADDRVVHEQRRGRQGGLWREYLSLAVRGSRLSVAVRNTRGSRKESHGDSKDEDTGNVM